MTNSKKVDQGCRKFTKMSSTVVHAGFKNTSKKVHSKKN